jgi:hypothetical protein
MAGGSFRSYKYQATRMSFENKLQSSPERERKEKKEKLWTEKAKSPVRSSSPISLRYSVAVEVSRDYLSALQTSSVEY